MKRNGRKLDAKAVEEIIETGIPPSKPPEHGVNQWLLTRANQLRNAGLTREQAFERIESELTETRKRREKNGERYVAPEETERAVARAWDELSEPETKRRSVSGAGLLRKPYKDETKFNPDKLAKFVGGFELGERWDRWLLRRSPIAIPADPMEQTRLFLSTLYRPEDKLVLFNRFISQGQVLMPVGELLERNLDLRDSYSTLEIEMLGIPTRHQGEGNGIWFLTAPVNGGWVDNPRDNDPKTGKPKRSRRCGANCERFPYALVESDKANRKEWTKVLALLPLPVLAVVDSGGRSLHALMHVNASTQAEFKRAIAGLKESLVPLGADKGCLRPVQLSRLPGCFRSSTKRPQRLLWLNDEPAQGRLLDFEPVRANPMNPKTQTIL